MRSLFLPLEQGILTNKYLDGFPADSRAVRDGRYLKPGQIDDALLKKVRALNKVAQSRDQTMAQMAIAWLLKDERVTSVLVGASKSQQLIDNVAAAANIAFSEEELTQIEGILENG